QFCESLRSYLPHEDFSRFMILVKAECHTPSEYYLYQNYPNPFNPTTDIIYFIPDGRSPTHTTLKIYNVLGQRVRTLIDERKGPGLYSINWDGKDEKGHEALSGVYLYCLKIGDFIATRRMLLLK
ncbi:MAG: T9SS type A sorting domain-containing protein, partial [Gemmatimonadota bacterium]